METKREVLQALIGESIGIRHPEGMFVIYTSGTTSEHIGTITRVGIDFVEVERIPTHDIELISMDYIASIHFISKEVLRTFEHP